MIKRGLQETSTREAAEQDTPSLTKHEIEPGLYINYATQLFHIIATQRGRHTHSVLIHN